MSMTTTAGRSFLTMATAWRPSSASPTTSKSSSNSSNLRNPSRTTVWSSASRIVIRFLDIQVWFKRTTSTIHSSHGLVERNLRSDGGAIARGGLDIKTATDHLQPFPHAKQSQAFAPPSWQHTLHLKGFAIIFYFHANAVRKFLDAHFHPAVINSPVGFYTTANSHIPC